MPISPIKLQRRMAELGRVRLGAKQGGKGRPMKLEMFRFTSPSERYIRDLAQLYGGEARAWDNNGKPEWEVFTDARSIPVIAVKGGLSQWMETWSGGGCVHRCDGERDVEGNLCDPNNRAHMDAKPTTRLSIMLPELDAIGVWRLESHGWNAAAEIPAVAELAQFVGDLVPAHLNLVERRAIKDGKTSRFVVPVLDLQIGAAKLREIVAEKAGLELEAPAAGAQPAAIAAPAEAASPAQQPEQTPPAAASGASSAVIPSPEQIAGMNADILIKTIDYLNRHNLGNHPATEAARQRLNTLQAAPAAEPVANADGTFDAEIVEDQPNIPTAAPSMPAAEADPDVVWQQILAAAGRLPQPMTTSQVQDDFAERMGGLMPDSAGAAELQHYLGLLTAGVAA